MAAFLSHLYKEIKVNRTEPAYAKGDLWHVLQENPDHRWRRHPCGWCFGPVGPASSYIRTGTRLASEGAHDMVPTNFEIERIETLVRDLDATVAQQRARVVAQEVDLEYLGERGRTSCWSGSMTLKARCAMRETC